MLHFIELASVWMISYGLCFFVEKAVKNHFTGKRETLIVGEAREAVVIERIYGVNARLSSLGVQGLHCEFNGPYTGRKYKIGCPKVVL